MKGYLLIESLNLFADQAETFAEVRVALLEIGIEFADGMRELGYGKAEQVEFQKNIAFGGGKGLACNLDRRGKLNQVLKVGNI